MIRIDVYRQYFTVTSVVFSKLLFTLYDFNKQLTTYKLTTVKTKGSRFVKPRLTTEEDKYFYIIETETEGNPNSKNQIRYVIECLKPLLEYLNSNGIADKDIKIVHHSFPTYKEYSIKTNPKYIPRPYQKEYIDKIVSWDGNNLLIDLQTGMGKTFIAMASVSRMKKRFSIVVLPRYIDKWIEDITTLTNIKEHEILVLKGTKSIINMLLMPKKDILKYKAVILSLKSITIFIKDYLTGEIYTDKELNPERIFDKLATEIVISDEVHQEFHNVYKLMLFSNIRLFIGLTATLYSKDKRLEKMYHLLFPDKNRISNIVPYNRYITVFSVRYRFNNKKNIRFKTTFGYSHAIFESSILKHSLIKFNYFNMLRLFLEKTYIKRREDGDKALVFMGTIDMCKAFIDYLKGINTFKKLKINKYTEEDDYEVISDSDIIVSTLGSSGTGIDIKGLIVVLQTILIDSIQSNLQSLGRLRKIEGKEVMFIYFYSSDIPQHVIYNRNRLRLFAPRVKSLNTVDYVDLI